MRLRTFPAAILVIACFLLPGTRAWSQKLYLPIFDSVWVRDQEPFRIAGNLYYVGSYELACYLITTPRGHILINTGVPGSDTMIRKHVEALGFKFSDIKILLSNQAHFDHVGAMAAIKQMTGAQLMIEEKDAPLLEDGGNSDFDMGGHGLMYVPVTVDRRLHDKEIVELGEMRIMVLQHPGHTKGASSFLFTVKDENRGYRVLIANLPTMLSWTKFPSMPTYPEVGKDYGYTLDTMPRISFDIWLASHGSQFGLQEKRSRAKGYHPESYMNSRPAYDSAIGELHAEYMKKMSRDTLFDNYRLEPVQVNMSITNIDGRKALRVTRDTATKGADLPTFVRLNNTGDFGNGTIEVTMLSRLLPTADLSARGFIGLAFRINKDNSRFESIYIRPTNGRAEDQLRRNHSIQYYSYPDYKFDRLRKEAEGKYESYADMGLNEWIKMKIVVKDVQARLYLNDNPQPALIVNDLKLGAANSGAIGLWVDGGTDAFFRDIKVVTEK